MSNSDGNPAQARAANRRRKLGLGTKLGFAFGSLEESVILVAGGVTMIYYNQVLGVSPALLGVGFLIAAIADAISDPVCGAISDAVRTKWGRRHPLMLASALPVALLFFCLYQPPAGLADTGLVVWMTACLVGLGIAKDFYAIPHTAMGAELTDDYDERTSLFGWNYILGAIATLAFGAAMYAIVFPSTPGFDNGLLNGARYSILAMSGAAICFVAILVCTVSTWDQIPFLHMRGPGEAVGHKRALSAAMRDTWTNLVALLQNRSFLSLALCWFVLAVSGGVLSVVTSYAQLYGFRLSTEQLAVLRFVTLAGIFLAVPLSVALTRWLDKKNTVIWTITISCLGVGAPYTLTLLDLFPPAGSAMLVPTIFVIQTLAYIALPIVPIVINSQLVDVADLHELRTGNRAEGMIFSARLFAIKATTGLGAVIAGIGLEAIRFPREAKAEELDPAVIDGLMFMCGPLYYIIVFGGLGLAALYNIDRKRHAEILETLEQRRRSAAQSAQ
jgi:Na+/melibiose symporter-like transporter